MLKKLLGRGGYGEIYLVFDENQKVDKAMKIIFMDQEG
jgi:serine/threonine protein kinase